MTTTLKVPAKVYRAVAASAHRGAKFLDTRAPGWAARINTTTLTMTAPCRCIYGQLHVDHLLDEFAEARKHAKYKNGNTVSEQFGYLLPESAKPVQEWLDDYDSAKDTALWGVLQEEWLREIGKRLGNIETVGGSITHAKLEGGTA